MAGKLRADRASTPRTAHGTRRIVLLGVVVGAFTVVLPTIATAATPTILDVNVAAGSDDAEESSTGAVSLTSTDLELVTDGTVVQTVGIRFASVSIPKTATISAAWIQFQTDEKRSTTTSLVVKGVASDNPGTFTKTALNVSSRPRTTASVAWNPVAWTVVNERGPNQRTPDLSAVVSEIVGRPGWNPGNPMAFIITGTGVRTAEAYNGSRPPTLHLEYLATPPPNQAPTADAGPDTSGRLPAGVSLNGSATDDGLPNGSLTAAWTQVLGPGTTTFTNPAAAATTATFSAPGDYVLQLTASDGALSASDQVSVTVAPPDAGPPGAPTGLTATVVGARRVDLSWTAPFDDVGVVSYDVLRDGTVMAHPATTTYSDTGVAPSSTYSYTVVALDAAGNASQPSEAASATTPAAPASAVFAAAGDHGANTRTAASLAALDTSGAEFYLALGDLDYDETPTDAAWCDYVKSHLPTVGPNFPFELVSGNHEEDGAVEGSILNHAACLPDRLNSTIGPGSTYGAEYAFDYPAGAPLMRVIMIPPGLTVAGIKYTYTVGTAPYNWLAATIDDARADGIPWVFVGMHYHCWAAGYHGCGIPNDLIDLLASKRVDVVLQAHDHNYERSKQVALNPSTCVRLPIVGYNANCVVDSGADHTYIKGAGTMFVIDGTFGKGSHPIDPASQFFPWFAATDGTTQGFTRYTVTPTRLDAQFVNTVGTYTDAWSILPAGSNQPPAVGAGPDLNVVLPATASLQGSTSDDGLPGPLTTTWSVASGPASVSFADPSAPSTMATFSASGTYVLRLTATDGALTTADDMTVTVLDANTPTVIEVPVTLASDDAEEAAAGGVSLSSSDLELVYDGSNQTVGIRFANLQIPKGSTINNAWIQFETDETKSTATSLTIQGQAADNPATFTGSTGNISTRPRTVASVPWTPPAWAIIQEHGANQRTPNLTSIVREIVARTGWNPGNAMAFVVTGSGVRTAEAYDGATSVPILHVEFTPGQQQATAISSSANPSFSATCTWAAYRPQRPNA